MNIFIRDIPDDIVAALDAEAERLGLSRNEYVRRMLTRVSADTGQAVALADLAQFEETFAGLADPELMDHAWQ
jgi:plasmid stability protein